MSPIADAREGPLPVEKGYSLFDLKRFNILGSAQTRKGAAPPYPRPLAGEAGKQQMLFPLAKCEPESLRQGLSRHKSSRLHGRFGLFHDPLTMLPRLQEYRPVLEQKCGVIFSYVNPRRPPSLK